MIARPCDFRSSFDNDCTSVTLLSPRDAENDATDWPEGIGWERRLDFVELDGFIGCFWNGAVLSWNQNRAKFIVF